MASLRPDYFAPCAQWLSDYDDGNQEVAVPAARPSDRLGLGARAKTESVASLSLSKRLTTQKNQKRRHESYSSSSDDDDDDDGETRISRFSSTSKLRRPSMTSFNSKKNREPSQPSVLLPKKKKRRK